MVLLDHENITLTSELNNLVAVCSKSRRMCVDSLFCNYNYNTLKLGAALNFKWLVVASLFPQWLMLMKTLMWFWQLTPPVSYIEINITQPVPSPDKGGGVKISSF